MQKCFSNRAYSSVNSNNNNKKVFVKFVSVTNINKETNKNIHQRFPPIKHKSNSTQKMVKFGGRWSGKPPSKDFFSCERIVKPQCSVALMRANWD